jgi:hypothetical protein
MEVLMHKGSCLCGAVTYEISGEMRPSIACHCTQCRKTSGHYWSATQALTTNLKVTNGEGLKWFNSSDVARRGFCDRCGSSLFWEMFGEGTTSIGAGTLDGVTGLTTSKHIFVADKGDYYAIDDGLLQLEQY